MLLNESCPRVTHKHHHSAGALAIRGVGAQLAQDLRLLGRAQPNVLVVGSGAATADLLPDVLATCRQPVHEVRSAGDGPWPDAGTLVFHDIAALGEDEQHLLHEWLDHHSALTQVVSIARTPVTPLLESGTFSETLFYRLNVVTLNADDY
jgi:hypothetical protein